MTGGTATKATGGMLPRLQGLSALHRLLLVSVLPLLLLEAPSITAALRLPLPLLRPYELDSPSTFHQLLNAGKTCRNDTRSIPSTNDRDTTQVREQKTANNYRGTGKSLFWIQRRNNKHRYR
jgi:hypothetical protein